MGKIKGIAILINVNCITTSLPKDQTIYVYCRSGRRSAGAGGYLTSLGYKVVDLEGGYLAWQKMQRR